MSLDQRFEVAAAKAKAFTKRPTDQELLALYALFKQATVGDNTTDQPSMFDLKGKAKWQAWNEKKGMPQDDAKEAYVAYVEELTQKYA